VGVGGEIPGVVLEAGGGEMLLEPMGVALAGHVVIADGEGKGDEAAEAVELLFGDGPLSGGVFVHDIADVGDEDDVLAGLVGEDPIDLSAEIGVGDGVGAFGGALGVLAEVALSVRDHDQGEGIGWKGRQGLGAAQGRRGGISQSRRGREEEQQEEGEESAHEGRGWERRERSGRGNPSRWWQVRERLLAVDWGGGRSGVVFHG